MTAILISDNRLQSLQTLHDDLDAAVTALFQSGSDDHVLARLKKRKLHIKDEIAAMMTAMMPANVAKAS
jgi:hypothetical protein